MRHDTVTAPDRRHTIHELLESLGIALTAVQRRLRPPFGEDLTYSQGVIMHLVAQHPGMAIKEIAMALSITSSAATQQVEKLVRRGYLLREGIPEDRRSRRIRVAERVQKKREALRASIMEKLLWVFDALSDEELAAYVELNRKIANGILRREGTCTRE